MTYFMPHIATALERNHSAMPHAPQVIEPVQRRRLLRWLGTAQRG